VTEEDILAVRGQNSNNQLMDLRDSLNENNRQVDFSQIINQPNFDAIAFLNYLLETQDFEK
jgi:hypothetical protein